MSRSMNTRANIRWKLLASVSTVALISSAYTAETALAADDDTGRPQVWIELGAQLERASGGDSMYSPPFFSQLAPPTDSVGKIIEELPWALGPEASISFQPDGSDWIFSAGIRYGRAKSHRNAHIQKPALYHYAEKYATGPASQLAMRDPYPSTLKCCHSSFRAQKKLDFSDVLSGHEESHLILDFQAGKDVGIGLFGQQSTSVLSAGVRFAQFRSKMDASVKALGDLVGYNYLPSFLLSAYPQKYIQQPADSAPMHSLPVASAISAAWVRTISWNASAALAGNSESSELTFDWGINAALLFGRQKAKVHHQTSGSQVYEKYNSNRPHPSSGYFSLYKHPRVDHIRSRNVTVPNVGGMAGFSIKFPNAKISIGYRADYFFGAMDGGWDTYKKENRSFMGPFASISVGLGD